RQHEVGDRQYFVADFDGDGTRDVAALYLLQISMADRLWILMAMGPRYERILHAQIGTRGRGSCRYVHFRGMRNGGLGFEFDTLYYEPGAPACCPSVPGRCSFRYEAGDIVESNTSIDWAKRVKPGDVPPPPWR